MKVKDTFNGMNKDDKDYVISAYNQFRDYLDDTDKIELKKELVNCMYKNKQFLTEFINSAVAIKDLTKKVNSKTIKFNSNLINKLRKKLNLKINDLDNTEQVINIIDKNINHRISNSIKVQVSDDAENNDDNIIISIDKDTETKVTPEGFILYKTSYLGHIIWFDPDSQVDYTDYCTKDISTKKILSKDELITQIKMIDEQIKTIISVKK
jgi:hypothetical protein